MKTHSLSDLTPLLQDSYYWERKVKFKFYEDTYKQWVIFAVEDGSFYYELDGKKGTATFGDLFVCPPHLPFRRVVETPLTFVFLRLGWGGISGNEPSAEELEMLPAGKISIQDTSRLTADIEEMKRAEPLDNERKLSIRSHYLRDIWLLYCRESGEAQRPIDQASGGKADPLMEKAAQLIQKHAYQKLDLKDIAGALRISPVRLTQKFKAHFGVTPIGYLTSIRMAKAKTLLLETHLTLEQISESIGYQSGYYLNRVFKSQMNMTPAKFREINRV